MSGGVCGGVGQVLSEEGEEGGGVVGGVFWGGVCGLSGGDVGWGAFCWVGEVRRGEGKEREIWMTGLEGWRGMIYGLRFYLSGDIVGAFTGAERQVCKSIGRTFRLDCMTIVYPGREILRCRHYG